VGTFDATDGIGTNSDLKDELIAFCLRHGGSGHITVRRGDRKSQIPMHGGGKELGKGLVREILKDLGLK